MYLSLSAPSVMNAWCIAEGCVYEFNYGREVLEFEVEPKNSFFLFPLKFFSSFIFTRLKRQELIYLTTVRYLHRKQSNLRFFNTFNLRLNLLPTAWICRIQCGPCLLSISVPCSKFLNRYSLLKFFHLIITVSQWTNFNTMH